LNPEEPSAIETTLTGGGVQAPCVLIASTFFVKAKA
jgi:hypothetical protein